MKKVKFWDKEFSNLEKIDLVNSKRIGDYLDYKSKKGLKVLKKNEKDLRELYFFSHIKTKKLHENLDHLTNYIDYLKKIHYVSEDQESKK